MLHTADPLGIHPWYAELVAQLSLVVVNVKVCIHQLFMSFIPLSACSQVQTEC